MTTASYLSADDLADAGGIVRMLDNALSERGSHLIGQAVFRIYDNGDPKLLIVEYREHEGEGWHYLVTGAGSG